MHGSSIRAATLAMTFLEIISVIILYLTLVALCDSIHYFFYSRKFTLERQTFNDTVRGFSPYKLH